MPWGVLAWLLYISMPWVADILGFAYLDILLALYSLAAVLAAMVWGRPGEPGARRWLLVAGLFAGGASGIKLQGLVVAAAVGAGVLLFSGTFRQGVRNLWWYGLACLAVCAFWYVRSYWVTGDPVHPAGGEVFGYYLWTPADLASQIAEQARHGVPRQWPNFLDGLRRVNAVFLCTAFLAPVFVWRDRRPWLLIWLVVVLLVLFWFRVSQVDRYLMPAVPLGALLALVPLRRLLAWTEAKAPAWPAGARELLVCAALSLMGIYAGAAGHRLREQPSVQAQRDGRSEAVLLQQAQALRVRYGDRVLNVGYENAFYYYDGQLMGGWFGPASFSRVSRCDGGCTLRSAEDVVQAMRRLGARLVLIHSERFAFDEQEFSSHRNLVARHGAGYLYALK